MEWQRDLYTGYAKKEMRLDRPTRPEAFQPRATNRERSVPPTALSMTLLKHNCEIEIEALHVMQRFGIRKYGSCVNSSN